MISSVAYLSMHTSPLLQPGSGYAGGMNVYIHELACTMAGRGIDVVVFTRRTSPDEPEVVEVTDGYRVVHLTAGPEAHIEMASMAAHVADFAEGVIKWTYGAEARFDLIHSHYWLSGWAGVLVKEALDIPLANSFHTLGRVKDLTRRADELPSSPMRTLTEEEVIAQSDCVIASTPFEFEDLMEHYGARPERLCTSPPGIDHDVFVPGDKGAARHTLGLGDDPMILFVGRITALKGLDVAVEALARLDASDGASPHLVVVGGPSGAQGDDELAGLVDLARRLGLSDRIRFVDPLPHLDLVRFYQAADVLVMPSRSESFGLVAAEAQACGLPVIAASVGGIRHVVDHGTSGVLVEGHDPAAFAEAISEILSDDRARARLAKGAIAKAESFSWQATADRFLELYSGITGK
jgi:D-inositol-3-phosphate glycosyltransferase